MAARLQRVVNWLRAGYPQGIPERDFVPLFALLRRRLSEDEARELAADLVEKGLIAPDKIDIAVGYLRITDELASHDELVRVIAHLRENGWEIRDEPLDPGEGDDTGDTGDTDDTGDTGDVGQDSDTGDIGPRLRPPAGPVGPPGSPEREPSPDGDPSVDPGRSAHGEPGRDDSPGAL